MVIINKRYEKIKILLIDNILIYNYLIDNFCYIINIIIYIILIILYTINAVIIILLNYNRGGND